MSPETSIVVAVGGNSLIVDSTHQSLPDQFAAAAETVHHIAALAERDCRLVITHGSGPQVGFILRRSELAAAEVPQETLDYADADLQGALGYLFQRAIHNEFRRRGIDRQAIALVTQVLVDPEDPAFRTPDKPVGPAMDESTARRRAEEANWTVRKEAGRGWRRVVPSPMPRAIVELSAIRALLDAGYVVIACGGGGIPVAEDADGNLRGVEAVIDKDHVSGLLASALGAELLVISTSVERVALSFGRPDQRWLDRMTVAEARGYDAAGQFAEGSMAPKVRAIVAFIEGGGRRGVIADPAHLGAAIAGSAGTQIVAE